jgi:hypothetical protein
VHRIAVVTAALAIAGCQTPNVGRLAEAQDLQRSRACRLSDGTGGMPISNQTAPITRMATANDRGWCWTTVWSGPGGGPHVAAWVAITKMPEHGEITTAKFDDATRVAYRPQPGYTGLDSFIVYDHDDYDTFPYQVTVNSSSSF